MVLTELIISGIISTAPVNDTTKSEQQVKTLPINPQKSDLDKILSNLSYNKQTEQYFMTVTSNVANVADDFVAMKKALATLWMSQKVYCGKQVTEKEAKNIEHQIDVLWNKYYAAAVKSNNLKEEGTGDCRIIRIEKGYKLNVTELVKEFDFIPYLFREVKPDTVKIPVPVTIPDTGKKGEVTIKEHESPLAKLYKNSIVGATARTTPDLGFLAGITYDLDIPQCFGIGAEYMTNVNGQRTERDNIISSNDVNDFSVYHERFAKIKEEIGLYATLRLIKDLRLRIGANIATSEHYNKIRIVRNESGEETSVQTEKTRNKTTTLQGGIDVPVNKHFYLGATLKQTKVPYDYGEKTITDPRLDINLKYRFGGRK